MKKMIVAILAVTLVFSLIGCDAMLNVMDKMSNNVAGTEKKVVNDSLNAAKPVPGKVNKSETILIDGKSQTTTNFGVKDGEDSKPLFSIVETVDAGTSKSETKLTLGEGDNKVEIPLNNETAKKLADVKAVLTPTDLSDVINGLKSGSKSEIESELKKPADEDSKKAAEGTQKVLNVLIESMDVDLTPKTPEEIEAIEDPEEKKAAEAKNKADVVVLTALNNVLFNNVEGVVGSMATIQDEYASEEKKNEASDKLMETVLNEATTLADIVSVVPSDMASGILGMMDILMSTSGN